MRFFCLSKRRTAWARFSSSVAEKRLRGMITLPNTTKFWVCRRSGGQEKSKFVYTGCSESCSMSDLALFERTMATMYHLHITGFGKGDKFPTLKPRCCGEA